MAPRPALVRLGWTVRDYVKRVWDNSAEDNVFFLAGGIAFNILLAAVPFILLLVAGLAWFLDQELASSARTVTELVDRLLPTHPEGDDTPMHRAINDALRARTELGLYSALGFVWFSTRLFGSLRSVLAEVFDIDNERGIIAGKIFDIEITILATLLFVANSALSAYLAIATTRGSAVLLEFGLRRDVMGGLEYWIGRLLAFAVILVMFFALYKFLPIRRLRAGTAFIAATFTAVMFEAAKTLYSQYVSAMPAGNLYSGTVAAVVSVVFWVYYAALIFILGGEVAQVYELRRVRRLQREVLYD